MEGRLTRILLLLAASVLSVAAKQDTSEPSLSPPLTAAIADAKAAMLVDPAIAIAKAVQAHSLLSSGATPNRRFGLAMLQWVEAEGCIRLNEARRSKTLIDSALSLTASNPLSHLRGDLLVTRGGYDSLVGDTARALADYQAAYAIFLVVADARSRALTLIDIGNLYSYSKDFTRALRYFKQAKETFSSDPQLSYFIHSNIGETYQDLGNLAKAEAEMRQSLILAEETKNRSLVKSTLRIMAQIELAQNKLSAADVSLARAVRLRSPTADDEDQAVLAVAAQAALQHNRTAQAVALIERSFAGVDLAHTTTPFRARHQAAYEIYNRTGDTAKALMHLQAMKRLDDESTRLATSTNTALMSARFDFANQELRIAEMQKAEAIARARTQRTISIGIGAGTAVIIVTLLAALVAILRSREEVRRANRDLARTNDALEQALRIKTEFLATTSHEIRTPLNGILGMTQVMLADSALQPMMRERVEIVHKAGETMRALVDDILDIAKLERGKMPIDMVATDLRAVLEDLSRLWAEQARAKGLRFTLDLDASLGWAQADATRLRQIVGNLLSNAIKFTPSGGVTLRAEAVDDPEPRYRVTVSDTGVGIAADKQALVFESFRQADASTTRQFGGTGLGLAICRQLARAMEGEVAVTSEPGGGSAFTLELPLYAVAPVEARMVVPTFLVIEANPIARATYRGLLADHVPALAFAGSVNEATAMIERGSVTRVLADDRSLAIDSGLIAGVDHLLGVTRPLDIPVTLLWTPIPDQVAEIERRFVPSEVIGKPVAKSLLVSQLLSNLDHPNPALVSRAA